VLANPVAGRGRAGRLAEPVRDALRAADLDVLMLVGQSAEESVALTAGAVADGVDRVVAIGGDGLVHCAVQALACTPAALAIVPAGTGNDLADVLGLPRDPVAAARVAVTGTAVPIDAGRCTDDAGNTRWFTTVLCAGFDSAVNERASQMRWPRSRIRYDLAAYLELARLRPRPARLTLDGEASERDVTLVAVGNCAQYGGGLKICPGARPDDGLFEVVVVAPISRTRLVRLKPLLRTGRHVEHDAVSVHQAREVRLEAPGVVGYADGERIGPLPLSASVVPGALHVLRPAVRRS
jgi:diacylglycerol kinase (ATP)